MTSLPHFFPAALFVTGAIITYLAGTPEPTPLVRPLATTMDSVFLGARGVDAKLDTSEVRASGVSEYLNRNFEVGSKLGPVNLYVGYHSTQQGDKRMHSPTLCLPGSGWSPFDARVVTVSAGGKSYEINRYVLAKDGEQILVYYWFQGRGRVTAGEGQLKMNAFRDALFNHRDEEALMRIVVPVGRAGYQAPIGATALPADSVATRLAATTIPAMFRALPPAT